MASINPMEFFNVGEKIGRVNSPVSGMGSAIRGILENARKMGLLQAQSNIQSENAFDLFKQKQDYQAGLPPETVPTAALIRDAEGELELKNFGNVPKGTKTLRPPEAPSPLKALIEAQVMEDMGKDKKPERSGGGFLGFGNLFKGNKKDTSPESMDLYQIEALLDAEIKKLQGAGN